MKPNVCRMFIASALAVVGAVLLSSARAAGPERPRIETISVSGQTVAVTVRVPAGIRKVTLESRSRVEAGAWVPRAVERLDGTGGVVTFRLPLSAQIELLRVRGDASEPLPAAFYAGTNKFGGAVSTAPQSDLVRNGSFDGLTGTPPAEVGGGGERAVVESDIWRLRGDTLYFFNQYRGLQVIRLTPPDAPRVLGTLPLAAAGEQLYVVSDPKTGADRVVLLARNGCGWGNDNDSQVLIVDPAPGGSAAPAIVTRVELPGYIQESRLVGTALYVATQTYRPAPAKPGTDQSGESWLWEYGTQVTSIDLADPDAPQRRDALWFPGYGNVIHATDRFLFVALNDPDNWWQSQVQLLDCSASDGTLRLAGSLHAAGHVADKFKLNLDGDVFTVISEVNRWSPSGRAVSVLETFSLADPARPRKLGQLEVGHGEGLYATRFDGSRAYLVTFLRVDPLWVVDLRDPAQPKVFGELEVPGWSTYIHPLGDRLVTIGVDNTAGWRVAVSLFDVRDPAHPALLARVPLGENHSWSEATWDEKAFAVLPEAGLILVPYQSWSENGQGARVQLIDLGPDSLKPRGVVEHAFQPRRATVHGERIVSVSGRELLSVDASDRDQPRVAARLELSWPVDSVLLAGEYLVEVSGAGNWFDPATPSVVRVVRAATPDEVLGQFTLPAGERLLAAARNDTALFVIQAGSIETPAPGKEDAPTEPKSRVRVTAFDLAALPALEVLGSAEVEVPLLGWGQSFQALWPRPGLLVLASQGGGWGWWRGPLGPGIEIGFGGAATPGRGLWWPGGTGGRLLAFQVADPATPRLVSDLDLGAGQNWWFAPETFTAGGLVYLSHQASEFREGVRLPGQPDPQPYEVVLPDGTREIIKPPVGVWVTRHFLDVVDYADPATPTVRPPVNLPGPLVGLAAEGALLFTRGPHWDAQGLSDGAEYLDACAYDGVTVSLVASLKQPAEWPRAAAVTDAGLVCVARPAASQADGGVLEAWRLNAGGAFELWATAALKQPADQLRALGPLLAARTGPSVTVLQTTDSGLTPVGQTLVAGCYWPDLTRAVAEPGRALWLPLGEYGLLTVPLAPAP
jgi:hypothetical protein